MCLSFSGRQWTLKVTPNTKLMQNSTDNVNQKKVEQEVGMKEGGTSMEVPAGTLITIVEWTECELPINIGARFGSFDLTDKDAPGVWGLECEPVLPDPFRTYPTLDIGNVQFGDFAEEEYWTKPGPSFLEEYVQDVREIAINLMEEFNRIELSDVRVKVAEVVETLPSVVEDSHKPGPHKVPKNKSVRTRPEKELHKEVCCDVFELGGRNTMKKIAMYKKAKMDKAPKEEREELRRKARDLRNRSKDPLYGFEADFRGQMFSFKHTVNVAPEVNSLVARVMAGFQDMTASGVTTTAQAIEGITAAMTGVASAAEGSVFNKDNMLDVVLSSVTKCMWMVPLIAASYFTVTSAVGGAKKEFAIGLGAMLAMLLPSELWEMIKALWPTPREDPIESGSVDWFDAQSGCFDIGTLSHVLTLALTYLTTSKKDTFSIAKDFMKVMPNYGRSVSGWKELSAFVVSTIESFVNFVRVQFGMKRIVLHEAGIEKVDDWCSRVMDVINKSNTGGDLMTPDNVALIIELRNEGKLLTEAYRWLPHVSPMLHKYLNHLDEVCKVCSAAMHMAKGGRAPPVVLMLTGKPGVGKTYLTKYITSYVLSEIISKERAEKLNYDFDSEVFQKGKSEYWNGYCGQKAVIIDDFAQGVPVAGMDNDYMDLIRMNSSWAFPLNFADLENKGKNFYVSEFIMATTNLTNINSCLDVIVEPSAITRRIDFGFAIEVAPEFSKGQQVDMEKIDAYVTETGDFPYHAWVLRKHRFALAADSYTDQSRVYTLKEVLDDVCVKMRSNKAYYENSNSTMANMLRKKYEFSAQMNRPTTFIEYLRTEGHVHRLYQEPGTPRSVLSDPFGPTWDEIVQGFVRLRAQAAREIRERRDALSGIIEHPLMRVLRTVAGFTLIFVLTRAVLKAVFSWFEPPTARERKKLKRALAKKNKVPDECLAQALDVFRQEDFEVIEEDNGVYKRVMRFTEDTFRRAYERIAGGRAQSNEPEQPRFAFRKITASKVIESDEHTAQADMYGDSIVDVANKNAYQVQVQMGDKIAVIGHILFIRDVYAIMPAHFDIEFRKALEESTFDDETELKFVNTEVEKLHYTIKLVEFLKYDRRSLPDDDVTMVKFVKPMRAHRDICDKFIRDGDLKSMKDIRVRLDTFEGTDRFIHRSRHMKATRMEEKRVTCNGGPYTLATSYQYVGYTRPGDCGGVVGLEEATDKQCRRIIGIHTAGMETLGLGLCNILTQEKICGLLQDTGAIDDKFYSSQSDFVLVDKYVEGSFVALHKMPDAHCMNPVSGLTRTKLHSKWGQMRKVPAPLKAFTRDGVKINPMHNAVLPYGSPVLLYDEHEVARAAHHGLSRLRELTKDADRRLYTFEEACAGVPGTTVNGIPRNTSPGYPYVLQGMTNKKVFFGKGDTYEFTSPECVALKLECERVLQDASQGKRNVFYFLDFLKDELRTPEKAAAGLTRLISSSPMVYLIVFRMMFLAFTRAVQETRIQNGIAVGINPYTEWNYLARKMKSKGPHCVAGDFKGFDSSEQPGVHWAILDEINAWYNDGPTNALIRRVLWMEVVHSRHIGGLHGKLNIAYQWNKSLPSGHPATSIINSCYNLIVFNMVWVRIMGIGYAHRFWEFVYLCVYGDDNILNVSPEIIDRFNQDTIAAKMAEIGMTYTNENKEGSVTKTRTLEEVSFLKRGFRYEDVLRSYVGPQELESILYVPYWCKNKSMIDEITLGNVEFTYQELSLHGPATWDEHAPAIRRAVRDVYKTDPQHYFTRDEYVRVTQESTMVWPL